jgi:hypothetical protein
MRPCPNGLNLFDVSPYYQRIAQGLLLLALVVLERLARQDTGRIGRNFATMVADWRKAGVPQQNQKIS